MVAIYHMLRDAQTYRDLGESFFERRDREHLARALTKRLARLGYEVELRPAA
jgi:hypothetical protein